MLRRMSSRQFAEWIEFYELEPSDAWLQAGTVAATVANAAGAKKDGEPLSPLDFIPGHAPEQRELTPQEELAIWRGLAAAMQG